MSGQLYRPDIWYYNGGEKPVVEWLYRYPHLVHNEQTRQHHLYLLFLLNIPSSKVFPKCLKRWSLMLPETYNSFHGV